MCESLIILISFFLFSLISEFLNIDTLYGLEITLIKLIFFLIFYLCISVVLVNRYMVAKGNGSTLRVTPSEVVFLVVTLEGMEATEVVPFVPSFPVVHSSMLVAGMAEVLKWHYYALIHLL